MLMTLNFYRTTNKGTDLNNFFDSISVHLTTVSSMSDQSIRSGESSVARLGKILPLGLLFLAGEFDSLCSGPEIK